MKINLNNLDTERINENTLHIDEMETRDILKTINEEDKTVAHVIENLIPNISVAVEVAYERLREGGRLVYIGAGTSGRLGVLDASECPPTYGVDASVIQALMAGGLEAIQVAKEGAEDSLDLAVEDLKGIRLTKMDVVCGLSASGRTPYVIGGLQYANSIGAETLSVCCVNESEISKVSHYPIEAVVGPEVVTGSTRMKAGTAQKLILNMISTTVMIKLGKVYGNLMVDVKPTNKKLVERAKSIIALCTECDESVANEYFEKSNRDVKVAITMILSKLNRENSIGLLAKYGGNIAKAVKNLEGGF